MDKLIEQHNNDLQDIIDDFKEINSWLGDVKNMLKQQEPSLITADRQLVLTDDTLAIVNDNVEQSTINYKPWIIGGIVTTLTSIGGIILFLLL